MEAPPETIEAILYKLRDSLPGRENGKSRGPSRGEVGPGVLRAGTRDSRVEVVGAMAGSLQACESQQGERVLCQGQQTATEGLRAMGT